MIRKTATAVVNLCDWMLGYHGVILGQLIYMAAVTSATITGIFFMFLVYC